MASCKDLCNHRRQITQSLLIVKFLRNKFSTSCILKLKLALFLLFPSLRSGWLFSLCSLLFLYSSVCGRLLCLLCAFALICISIVCRLFSQWLPLCLVWQGQPTAGEVHRGCKTHVYFGYFLVKIPQKHCLVEFFNFVFETVKVVMMRMVFIFIHIPFFFSWFFHLCIFFLLLKNEM